MVIRALSRIEMPGFVLAGGPGRPSGRFGVVARQRGCISAETLARPYLRTITHCCPSDVTVSPVTVHRRQSYHPAAVSVPRLSRLSLRRSDFRALFRRPLVAISRISRTREVEKPCEILQLWTLFRVRLTAMVWVSFTLHGKLETYVKLRDLILYSMLHNTHIHNV